MGAFVILKLRTSGYQKHLEKPEERGYNLGNINTWQNTSNKIIEINFYKSIRKTQHKNE